jgi:hypothetical protein
MKNDVTTAAKEGGRLTLFLPILLAILGSLAGCATYPLPPEPGHLISIEKLLANKEKYQGKEVYLAAYDIRHIEGSWFSSKDAGSEPRLSIKYPKGYRYISDEFADRRKWKPIPVIVEGKFRIGNYEHGNRVKVENQPYIDVRRVYELSGDDKVWRKALESR